VAANLIALGVLAALGRLFDPGVWTRAIRDTVPSRFLDMNLNAFELGHREGLELLGTEEGRKRVAFDRKRPVCRPPRREDPE